MHALLTSDPGGTGAPGHSALAMLPSAPGTASAPANSDFGAQSHGLHLRCLRFAVTVTQAPRKTRFRAVASLTRAGLDPQDLFGKFPSDSSHVISSPFPELCSAHATYRIVRAVRRGENCAEANNANGGFCESGRYTTMRPAFWVSIRS